MMEQLPSNINDRMPFLGIIDIYVNGSFTCREVEDKADETVFAFAFGILRNKGVKDKEVEQAQVSSSKEGKLDLVEVRITF